MQETVNRALSTLLRAEIGVTGAGRTDTGVNASYYVAHFDCPAPIADVGQLIYKLNFLLPGDIAVSAIRPVRPDAHARFSRDLSWQYYVPLDLERMNRAAALLPEFDDFTSFAKLNSNNKTNICRISHAAWTEQSEDVWRFTIRADRFLRNMVRSIVGTLVDVGRGRYTVEQFREIVAARDLSRSSAGAPAQGLFLSDVTYKDDIYL